MKMDWWRRLIFLALGVLLAVLVWARDISPIPAILVLALAGYDIASGLRGSGWGQPQ